MKKILYLSIVVAGILYSCSNTEDISEQETSYLKEDYIKEDDNYYQEFYGGNDQLKMEGAFDKDKNRHGIWKYYTVDGKTLSITEYKNGIKHGYSIVYAPNGALKYRGEYADDKQVGEWKFYNSETGQLDKTVDYGYPK